MEKQGIIPSFFDPNTPFTQPMCGVWNGREGRGDCEWAIPGSHRHLLSYPSFFSILCAQDSPAPSDNLIGQQTLRARLTHFKK